MVEVVNLKPRNEERLKYRFTFLCCQPFLMEEVASTIGGWLIYNHGVWSVEHTIGCILNNLLRRLAFCLLPQSYLRTMDEVIIFTIGRSRILHRTYLDFTESLRNLLHVAGCAKSYKLRLILRIGFSHFMQELGWKFLQRFIKHSSDGFCRVLDLSDDERV